MVDNIITIPLINEFFWNAPNPMAITKADDGTYIEVNKAFIKCIGLQRQEIIGQTSVGCGYITARQRKIIFNEINKKGYARNIKLEVRVKDNKARYGLFNSSLIKSGDDGFWLTVVTDISEHIKAVEKRHDAVLLKSLAAIERTGVILIRRDYQNQKRYSFFINKKAKMILNGRPLKDLLSALNGRDSLYFFNNKVCYHVKSILTRFGSPGRIIFLEPVPDAVYMGEILKQYDLTLRQREIALLTAMGDSNKNIAAKLFITEYTVKII